VPWLRRRRVRFALGGAVLVSVGLLGPRERFDDVWVEPELPADLDAYLRAAESAVPGIRAGDERAIAWYEGRSGSRTPLSLVYLHGFSADRHEVDPLVSDLAAELGANVYYARLRGHGRDGAAMAEATVDDWLADAAEAVAIGGRIGDRVVVVGTSTGGTLAAWIATRAEAADRLAAVVMLSPNFHPLDRSSRLLLVPWGGQIARAVVGAERCFTAENAGQERHWTTCYPTSALLPMMALVEHVRTSDLTRIDVPTLIAYSINDRVVDPTETERVWAGLERRGAERFIYNGAADPGQHVLAGDILSPESTELMMVRLLDFLRPLS